MTSRTVIGCASLLLHAGAATAQVLEKEAAFLLIPSGARTVGLGRAVVSIADAQAAFYNPAATAWSPLALSVSRYDGPLDFVAWRLAGHLRAGNHVISIGAQVQSFGEFQLADEFAVIGTYEPQNLIVELGLSRHVSAGMVAGMRAKLVDSRVAPGVSATGFAADMGFVWRVPHAPVQLGASLLDLGTALRYGTGEANRARLPTRLRAGASMETPLAGRARLLLTADANVAPHDTRAFSQFLGGAITWDGLVTARAGFIRETLLEPSTGWSFGLGFNLGIVSFDLGREIGVNNLGSETHISLGYRS